MFKTIHDELWALDAEWVPDPPTGRRVYGLPAELDDDRVVQHMWQAGGATEDEPQPYLKTVLCRVVSVSAMIRCRQGNGLPHLRLYSLPAHDGQPLDESTLLQRLLSGLGEHRPQLVGFNIRGADLPIILERALVQGLAAPKFCARPAKPWEGVDYFARSEDWVIDLKDLWGAYGKGAPSLHELATAARIPGKMALTGDHVCELWRAGRIDQIVAYNEFDAVSTYLLWLRAAHLAGLLDTGRFTAEEQLVRELLEQLVAAGRRHLQLYLDCWERLRAA